MSELSVALPPPLLRVEGVNLQYRTRERLVQATHDVSFDVWPGDRFVLLGPSGCGKSSLLKAIGGFLPPVSGAIRLAGETVNRPGPDRMMVFQEFDQLPPWKTVAENIAFPLIASRRAGRAEAMERAEYFLHKVGLGAFRHAYPNTLSGGMKQRVAIARALALRPSVLLADEATSGLDPQATATVLNLLKRLRDEYRLAIVLITHEMDAVRAAADAVAEIRDGAIVQFGQVKELLARPDSLLGQQLLPLSPVAAHSDLLLRLSYRWDVPVVTDWISRLSQQFALQIDLLGGHVEVINGRLAGRLQVGVRFQGERLPPSRVLALLAQLGIAAEVLDDAPELKEAV